MKNDIYIFIFIALTVGLVGGFFIFGQQKFNSQTELMRGGNGYGNNMGQAETAGTNRDNCLADDCLTVEGLEYPAGELSQEAQSALNEAINDEYKALSTYEAVMDRFGSVRPFSMIKGAEEQHIASLKAIYDKYGLEVPENAWPEKVTVPATLQEACQTGVDAEIANASLYRDTLLSVVFEYADITAVFENLMNASQAKHLPAFDRCN